MCTVREVPAHALANIRVGVEAAVQAGIVLVPSHHAARALPHARKNNPNLPLLPARLQPLPRLQDHLGSRLAPLLLRQLVLLSVKSMLCWKNLRESRKKRKRGRNNNAY